MVVYEFGYPTQPETRELIQNTYRGILNAQWVIITLIYVLGIGSHSRRSILSHSVTRGVVYGVVSAIVLLQLSLVFGWLQRDWLLSFLTGTPMVRGAVLLISVAQISRSVTGLLSRRTNPPFILAASFALIIVVGTLLLMLPNSTHGDISWIDALFVSTSAVCVTGLTPLDVATTFTTTGQMIILLLIQIGGLGIMTITSFFALFFAGGRSFSGQMVVGDILSTERLSSLLRTIIRILAVTFSIEAVGALMLYISATQAGVMDHGQALYFGVFHSVSAFCNAGFSTLSGNLSDPLIVGIGSVRYVIGFLIIFGGIGFPIFSNFLSILAHKFRNLLRQIYGIRPVVRPRLWSLNTSIVVRTTLFLLVGAFILFLAFEWNGVLASMSFSDKLSQGFLLAVTPRTAGFNAVDLRALAPVSVLLTIVLMWIGGAPQSTAGGVKVTTIYVAVRNIFSSVSGSGNIEARGKQIPSQSVARAFGVISLSIIFIGTSVLLLSLFEPQIPLADLVYEAVSAISTVGLSLSTTPLLCEYSKIILILLMFAGRIGVVALFLVFVRPSAAPKPYAYPQENIMIT